MEQAIIAGVAHDRSEAKITVVGVPDKVGEAARIFEALAAGEVNIDMVVQNISAAATGLTDISFTLPREPTARPRWAHWRGSRTRSATTSCCTTTRSARCPSSAPACARTPASPPASSPRSPRPGVNIEMISTSEIRISVIVDEALVDTAVQATHTAFDLDSDEVEAVVYGGTGR